MLLIVYDVFCMINVWAGEATMSGVAAECAGRRPGFVGFFFVKGVPFS